MHLSRNIFFFLFFSFSTSVCIAQENKLDSTQTDIIADERIAELIKKHIEINEKSNGKIQGYRIKIYFGSERSKANEVRTDFLTKYPEMPAYEEYQQPNFPVSVGDFRTRLDAHRFLKKIALDFPGAFIVQTEIELPTIE